VTCEKSCESAAKKTKKSAIITGASRGIGYAIACELASVGYNIALLARSSSGLSASAEAIQKEYKNKCLAFVCDVCDDVSTQSAFRRTFDEFGSIDVLVNNAGVNSRRTLNPKNPDAWFADLRLVLEGWNEEIKTNLTAVYFCSYVAAGYMLKQGSGSIINISSVKGREPTSSPGYGASKAGVIKLTKDLAKHLSPYGIRVNCVAPGFIEAGMTLELSEEKQQAYKLNIPMARFGLVEEVAKVVSFLTGSSASYITGATIDVNGGYLM
jgi:3-oxoacyl-[acyl-carrier protein] reductase